MNQRTLAFSLVAAVILAGCGGGEGNTVSTVNSGSGAGQPMVGGGTAPGMAVGNETMPSFSGMPGLPARNVADGTKLFASEAQTVAARYGSPRSDPFALKPAERSFDTEQDAYRILGEMGGFTVMFTPPEEKDPMEGVIQEDQPYRRLSGIIVGDSIYAILLDGGQTTIIRPGMRLPNSEWTVASIDEEKAVLTRSGNKLPKRVVVRLESPPAGMGGGANTGQGAGNSGAPGPNREGGRPGAPGAPSMGGAGSGGGGGGSQAGAG